jgi:hypothetical protein
MNRVIVEKHELDVKIEALKGYLWTLDLKDKDYRILTEQLDIMSKYSAVLSQRVRLFAH